MENNRDDLVVFGAGYPNAMQRMLSANQGLRRRFSTTILFESYTPDELWQLTSLIAARDEDIVAAQSKRCCGRCSCTTTTINQRRPRAM